MSSNYDIVTFPHANIISNVKHFHLYYITIVYTQHLLFQNPGFIFKNRPSTYAIDIINSPNFSVSCYSGLTLNKFPLPSPISNSPSIITTKSIHHTGSKVTPHLISDIFTSTMNINIQPQYQPNAYTHTHIRKLMV